MTLTDKIEEAAKKGIREKIAECLPHSQLDDYDEENLTEIGDIGFKGLEIYRWEDNTNTLYLLHRPGNTFGNGLTIATMSPQKAEELITVLGNAIGEGNNE